MSDKVSQSDFMAVKQLLDYYHLPTTFPIQATPLLAKLLAKLKEQHPHVTVNAKNADVLDNAVKHYMGRVIKENNTLHMQIITAKEEIQSLSHQLNKLSLNKHRQQSQNHVLGVYKSQKEEELFEELTSVKYKYNELMNILHEDPLQEKQYLKRLLKHKQLSSNQRSASSTHSKHSEQKQNHHQHRRTDRQSELELQVVHREKQILRLQKVIEYDGINMNKVLKDFQNDLATQELKNAKHKIEILENSLDETKSQNQSMKSKGGIKEALRIEVEKCHQIIKQLKAENQQLTKSKEKNTFDLDKKEKVIERKIKKSDEGLKQVENQKRQLEEKLIDLEKHINFLERENQDAKKQNEEEKFRSEETRLDHEEQKKNYEDKKLYYEYEIENLKQRCNELADELSGIRNMYKSSLDEGTSLKRENQLKSMSIGNLQLIVEELSRKNSILTDQTRGESSIKQDQELQLKRKIIEVKQHWIHAENQRDQKDIHLRSAEQRLSTVLKENQKLRQELMEADEKINHLSKILKKNDIQNEELLKVVKKEKHQHEICKIQLSQAILSKEKLGGEIKKYEETISLADKHSLKQIKNLEVIIAEQEEIISSRNVKIEQREGRIKHLELILNQMQAKMKEMATERAIDLQKNHQLSKDLHRWQKKSEEVSKENDLLKNETLRNYEMRMSQNLNENVYLKAETHQLVQSNQQLTQRCDELTSLLNLVDREKELLEVEKVTLARETEHLRIRVHELQTVERNLVIENQNLRNFSRRS